MAFWHKWPHAKSIMSESYLNLMNKTLQDFILFSAQLDVMDTREFTDSHMAAIGIAQNLDWSDVDANGN